MYKPKERKKTRTDGILFELSLRCYETNARRTWHIALGPTDIPHTRRPPFSSISTSDLLGLVNKSMLASLFLAQLAFAPLSSPPRRAFIGQAAAVAVGLQPFAALAAADCLQTCRKNCGRLAAGLRARQCVGLVCGKLTLPTLLRLEGLLRELLRGLLRARRPERWPQRVGQHGGLRVRFRQLFQKSASAAEANGLRR